MNQNNQSKELFHANFEVDPSRASDKIVIPNGCKILGSNQKVTIRIVFPDIKNRVMLELQRERISNEILESSRIFTIIPWTDQEAQIIRNIVFEVPLVVRK
jgi:hypothetical protein